MGKKIKNLKQLRALEVDSEVVIESEEEINPRFKIVYDPMTDEVIP